LRQNFKYFWRERNGCVIISNIFWRERMGLRHIFIIFGGKSYFLV
jgi:hypothetical protein